MSKHPCPQQNGILHAVVASAILLRKFSIKQLGVFIGYIIAQTLGALMGEQQQQ